MTEPSMQESVQEESARPLPARRTRPTRPEPSGDMSVVDHLEELRSRIIKCLIAWGIAAALVWGFNSQLMDWIKRPLPHGQDLIITQVTEAFMITLKIALVGGLLLAGPVLLYQILMFVMPALTRGERRAVLGLVPFGILLFVGGIVFAYFMILPTALKFLLGFGGTSYKVLITAENYINFVVSLSLLVGLIFQMPLLMLGLSFIGLVNGPLLSKYRRYAYFGCFVLAMLVAPTPDPFSMIMIASPMVLLYEVSIILVRFIRRPDSEATS